MKTITSVFLASAVVAFAGCSIYKASSLGTDFANAKAAGAPILIYAIGIPGQIDARKNRTAVPVYIQFLVTADQSIEHIRFFFTAYSQRGDPVLNRQGQHLEMELLGPGQFTPGGNYEVNSFHSSPAGFPGGDVACVELRRMVLTYSDGQEKTFNHSLLSAMIVPQLRHRCVDQGPKVESLMTSSNQHDP